MRRKESNKKKKRRKQEEERVRQEEKRKQRQIESREEEKMIDSDNEVENKEMQDSPVEMLKQQDSDNEEEEEVKDEKAFPLPSKEDWRKLTFEPEFDVQQYQDKYTVYSKISNLNIKDISLKTSDNKLTIEGIKYPTKEEENLLVKKLMMSLRNPYLIKNFSRSQIISAILKIGSQYSFGRFSASYRLPPNLDSSESINASYQNGILKVDLPIKRKSFTPHSQYSRRPEVPFYQRNNPFFNFF